MKNALAIRIENADKNVRILFVISECMLTFLITCLFLHSIEVCTFHFSTVRIADADIVWKDLINKLPRAMNAMHEFNRVDKITTCFKDTRTSVLNGITQWIDRDEDKCIFWLNGMAGIGKTTISRTIVEKNKENESILLASFFFSRDYAQASDSLLVFPTLALQLARKHPKATQTLVEMIEENPDCASHPLSKQFNEFIINPLKSLGHSRYTVLFVLDALDECSSKEDTSSILELLLAHAASFQCKLRILVTSRPENSILSVFNKAQNHEKIVLHDIEKIIVDNDIKQFVRLGLQVIFDEYGLQLPSEADIMRLVDRSGSLFIFAATALRYIGDNIARNPKMRLQVILGDNEHYKSKPYSAVDKLYWTILDKAVPADHDALEEIAARFQRVVGTIVTLRDPLPLSALSSIVKSGEDFRGALDHLHSVIRVPTAPGEATRVLHPSFVDFITNKERCTDSRFLVDVPAQDILLAQRCLELMIDSLRRNMAGIEDMAKRNVDVTDLEGMVKNALPNQLRYACLHWASHMIANGHADEKCLFSLKKFTCGS